MLTNLSRDLWRAHRGSNVKGRVARYGTWFDRNKTGDYDHTETVNDYYDLCSEFMQFGWTESLHFAPLKPGETLEDSIIRHQRLMIDRLQLREGMTIIDIGCGVGGRCAGWCASPGRRCSASTTTRSNSTRPGEKTSKRGSTTWSST